MAHPDASPLLRALETAPRNPGRLVPSVLFKSYRVRPVGSRIYMRPPRETFPEFLIWLLKATLGEAWHRTEQALPLESRHQIHRWYAALNKFVRSIVGNPLYRSEDVWVAAPPGDILALLLLAYDVCHLLHAGHIPAKLLDRLKDRREFQGARYEMGVAGTFIRAGFHVRFLSEKQRKHCDLIARDDLTGVTIAVEAKSRRRPGILHEPGEINEAISVRADVADLINDAIEQQPGDRPFMVFIDLNMPYVPNIPYNERAWYRDVSEMIRSIGEPTTENPDIFTAFVFTNFAFHWQESRPAGRAEHFEVISTIPRYPVSPDLMTRIVAALDEGGTVPAEV